MSKFNLISILILPYLFVATNSQNCNQESILSSLKNCVSNGSTWNLNLFENKLNNNRNDLIDMIRLLQTINNHVDFKSCFKLETCNALFSDCEFKFDANNSSSFDTDSLVASRLASLLTGFTYNEASDSRTYLNLNQLYSLLEISLLENDNVYDATLIFKDQKAFNLKALKTDKSNF